MVKEIKKTVIMPNIRKPNQKLPEKSVDSWDAFYKQGLIFSGCRSILEEPDLSCQARILFFIISSFAFSEGYCYATNLQLSEKLGLKETMVKKYIIELHHHKFVILKFAPTAQGIRRRIFINFEELERKYITLRELNANINWVDKKDYLDDVNAKSKKGPTTKNGK